jgi:hypothetical protein
VIAGFAEEGLLDMAVHAARSMGLSGGCRGFSGFEECLEAAQILLDHEGRICTESGEEATANCREGLRIFHLSADGRATSLGVIPELDLAAAFNLRVGQ